MSVHPLVPPERGGPGGLPVSRVRSAEAYRSRFRGALLGGAIGDALGRPAEGRRRKPDSDARPVSLKERIAELPDLIGSAPEDAFAYLYNGAFVLESLPAAIWCFLSSLEDAERVLVTAANGGYDADTVAAMAGNLAGAYCGEDAFPDRWLEDLEFASELRDLADSLVDRSGVAS